MQNGVANFFFWSLNVEGPFSSIIAVKCYSVMKHPIIWFYRKVERWQPVIFWLNRLMELSQLLFGVLLVVFIWDQLVHISISILMSSIFLLATNIFAFTITKIQESGSNSHISLQHLVYDSNKTSPTRWSATVALQPPLLYLRFFNREKKLLREQLQ